MLRQIPAWICAALLAWLAAGAYFARYSRTVGHWFGMHTLMLSVAKSF